MSVSVDTVYQRVLSILNKEQRGYVTPQEFNLFANQAQMDLFEQYFYDINQFGRMHGNDTEFSDMLNILNEKINIFEVTAAMTNAGGGVWTVPANLYRIGTIIYNNTEVERINQNEFLYINKSPLTKPSNERPVFVASASGYKVYGSLIVRSSNSTLNGTVSSSATINISAANPSISIGNIVTGTGISGVVTVTAIAANGTAITLSSVQSLSNSTVLTFTTPAATQLITTEVTCNYIKRPATAEWAGALVDGSKLQNSSASVDFELHPSEETELVIKILELAGISTRELQVYQIAAQEEARNTQQEKS
tara:strand:+ start:430 stop:1353 length:924 start_codon:yes stop_codon:yes gene_type:complete